MLRRKVTTPSNFKIEHYWKRIKKIRISQPYGLHDVK